MEEAGGERGAAPGGGGGPGSSRHAGEVEPPHVSSKDSQEAPEEEAGPRSRTGGAVGSGEESRTAARVWESAGAGGEGSSAWGRLVKTTGEAGSASRGGATAGGGSAAAGWVPRGAGGDEEPAAASTREEVGAGRHTRAGRAGGAGDAAREAGRGASSRRRG